MISRVLVLCWEHKVNVSHAAVFVFLVIYNKVKVFFHAYTYNYEETF
jgi:hypothetical protein